MTARKILQSAVYNFKKISTELNFMTISWLLAGLIQTKKVLGSNSKFIQNQITINTS